MGDADDKIKNLEAEISLLKAELLVKENELWKLRFGQKNVASNKYTPVLSAEEITRYSRQILVPTIGTTGQEALKASSVLIVGAGGLGCPCALYLAAAGIGDLTLVDYDSIELSNLHRQVLYGEEDLQKPKVAAAYKKLRSINPNININGKHMHITSDTITELFNETLFNVVIDGSDNVPTRYLLNDICVLKGVPLVSGSALQTEGQLTVYNHKGGPCYRCLFPQPPPPETVTSCGDGGVLGPVPGTIGVLQAMEAIKILTGQPGVLSSRLLTFDAADTTFRNIRLRNRNINCVVCGDSPSITSLIDYEQFCGAKADDKVHNISLLKNDEHIKPELLSAIDNLLIDVRPELEYQMCHIPESINVPLKCLENVEDVRDLREKIVNSERKNVCVICRRGNDSQKAILCLKEKLGDLPVKFMNVTGGLHQYSKNVDDLFPIY